MIDMEEMTAFIAQQTGHTEGIVYSILECELEFLKSKGLAGDGPDDPSLATEPVFVDTDELENFIVKRLVFLSGDVIVTVLQAEDDFMRANGIID